MVANDVTYSDHSVGLIDILGFRNHLETAGKDARAVHAIWRLLTSARDQIREYEEEETGVPANKAFVQMYSDSILVTDQVDCGQASTAILELIALFENQAAQTGFFFRGGVACGSLFRQGEVVFGPALVEAYDIESRAASWPRVVLSPHSLAAFHTEDLDFYTRRAEDGLRFVDYLSVNVMYRVLIRAAVGPALSERGLVRSDVGNDSTAIGQLVRHATAVRDAVASLKPSADAGLLARYYLLATYHNSVVDEVLASAQGADAHSAPELMGRLCAKAMTSPLGVTSPMAIARAFRALSGDVDAARIDMRRTFANLSVG